MQQSVFLRRGKSEQLRRDRRTGTRHRRATHWLWLRRRLQRRDGSLRHRHAGLRRVYCGRAGCVHWNTNHDPAIDEAFRRRIAVHVRFPLPDEDERAKLWRAMLPASAPVDDDLELVALARKYLMGGGNIRNAVLRAAFLAADASERIGNYHLRQAAQLEYEGMGKLAVVRD